MNGYLVGVLQNTHKTEQNLNVIQKLLISLGNNVGGIVIILKRCGIMSCDMFGSSIDLIHHASHASTLNSNFDGPFKITALSYHFDIYYKRFSPVYMVPTYISSNQYCVLHQCIFQN
jgi:hypothetical protein